MKDIEKDLRELHPELNPGNYDDDVWLRELEEEERKEIAYNMAVYGDLFDDDLLEEDYDFQEHERSIAAHDLNKQRGL